MDNELTEMFLHYVRLGVFKGLTVKDAEKMIKNEDLTIEELCRGLMERVG